METWSPPALPTIARSLPSQSGAWSYSAALQERGDRVAQEAEGGRDQRKGPLQNNKSDRAYGEGVYKCHYDA
eukprot:905127-Pyramimonas_sp.AAC.1